MKQSGLQRVYRAMARGVRHFPRLRPWASIFCHLRGLMAHGARSGDNKRVKTLHLIVDAAQLETATAQEAARPGGRKFWRAGGLVALRQRPFTGWERTRSTAPPWSASLLPSRGGVGSDYCAHCFSGDARRVGGGGGLRRRGGDGAFWPGPLTLLLPRAAAVRTCDRGPAAGGVRMPAHPVALGLIRRAGVSRGAPSANRFGHISPTTAQHVLDDLDGRIDAVVDAGPSARGVESTVLDPRRRR